MNRVLQQIIAQDGISILQEASRLRERIVELGGNPKDAITLELMLTACPSIAPALSQGDLPQSEVNVLISSVIRTTGLSVATVRRALGDLITASGNHLSGHAPFCCLFCIRNREKSLCWASWRTRCFVRP